MKSYSKEHILSEIISLLNYHKDEKTCLLFANLLLNKVNTNEEIILSKEEISNFLFVKDSDEINETADIVYNNLCILFQQSLNRHPIFNFF